MTETNGIRRIGPPVAVQKVRDNVYMIQVALSEPPSADWKRLFYDTQRDVAPDFPPRAVDLSANLIRFRSDAESVEQKLAAIERWIERANQKEASLGVRSEDERRRRDEHARERQDLDELNRRWAKL